MRDRPLVAGRGTPSLSLHGLRDGDARMLDDVNDQTSVIGIEPRATGAGPAVGAVTLDAWYDEVTPTTPPYAEASAAPTSDSGYETDQRARASDDPASPDRHPDHAYGDAVPAEGLTGRGLVATTLGAVTACALLDLALTGGHLTYFFDLCFVVTCLVTTMAVRREDLFTAGVLPPLAYGAVIAVLALVVPTAFRSGPGVNQTFLTGLADHAVGLVAGYAVTLATITARMSTGGTGDERIDTP